MVPGQVAAGAQDLRKRGTSVDQTVQPFSSRCSEEDGKQSLPEYITKNYQVIIFPGSKRQSAGSPVNRSPNSRSFHPTLSIHFSQFCRPTGCTHTLRFTAKAFYSTQLPGTQNENLLDPISWDLTSHSKGPWLRSTGMFQLAAIHGSGSFHTLPSLPQAAACLGLFILNPDPLLFTQPKC